jgi:Ca2+-binding EF-hand superfamily protein
MSGECANQGINKGSLDRVLAKYDTDNTGDISFDEFKEAFFST